LHILEVILLILIFFTSIQSTLSTKITPCQTKHNRDPSEDHYLQELIVLFNCCCIIAEHTGLKGATKKNCFKAFYLVDKMIPIQTHKDPKSSSNLKASKRTFLKSFKKIYKNLMWVKESKTQANLTRKSCKVFKSRLRSQFLQNQHPTTFLDFNHQIKFNQVQHFSSHNKRARILRWWQPKKLHKHSLKLQVFSLLEQGLMFLSKSDNNRPVKPQFNFSEKACSNPPLPTNQNPPSFSTTTLPLKHQHPHFWSPKPPHLNQSQVKSRFCSTTMEASFRMSNPQ